MKQRILRFTCTTLRWSRDHLPPGVRTLAGLLLMIGGVFGFLPILGFWMIPLGAAVVALDVPPLRLRVDRWLESLEAELTEAPPAGETEEDPPGR